jgi:hypothetical protein
VLPASEEGGSLQEREKFESSEAAPFLFKSFHLRSRTFQRKSSRSPSFLPR